MDGAPLLEDVKDLASIAEAMEKFIRRTDWIEEFRIEDQVRSLASLM